MQTFILRKSRLAKIEEVCKLRKLKLVTSPMSVGYIQMVIGEEAVAMWGVPYLEEVARGFVWASVEAEQPVDLAIHGAASKVEGGFKLQGFGPRENLARFVKDVSEIDFLRCDKCQIKHDRVKTFFITYKGQDMQVGGDCAAELDVEKHVRRMLAECFDFLKYHEDDCMSEDMFFQTVKIKQENVSLSEEEFNEALSIMYGLVLKRGYVSKSSAAFGEMPTAYVYDELVRHAKQGSAGAVQALEKMRSEVPKTLVSELIEHYESQEFSDFNHNLLSVLRLRLHDAALLAFSCFKYIKIQEQKVKAQLPKVVRPFDFSATKATDLDSVFILLGVYPPDENAIYPAFTIRAVNNNGEGIQFKQSGVSEDLLNGDGSYKIGAAFTVRASYKCLSRNGLFCVLQRAKIKVLNLLNI